MQKDFKSTLNLPKTDFPMKANLPLKEPDFINQWTKKNIYQKMVDKKKPQFTFLDGPPYANGPIHLGHVLNKVLKDFIVKYKNMSGWSLSFYSNMGLPRTPH